MKRCRLVLFPCPFQGHINPMLQFATILHSKGFSITIIHTKFNSPDPSYHPYFSFQSIPDDLFDGNKFSGKYTPVILSLNQNCVAHLKECLFQMMKQQEDGEEIACIIHDKLMYLPEAVAKSLQLPSFIFRTNSAATFLSRACVFQHMADGCIPLPDSVMQNPLPGHYPLRYKDLPTSNLGTSEEFMEVVSNVRKIGTSKAIIWSTTDCLEMSPLAQLQQQCKVPIFAIGPMHKFAPASSNSLLKEDTSSIAWLDKQSHKSVIYISLGSLASMDENEVAEMAWGLANSNQPFLWVIRPGSIRGSKWIESLHEGFQEGIGKGGCMVKWAPQKKVLAHDATGGFWTHCGWNSTMESICEGLPMICRPSFGDQKVTARYVSQVWKVGLQMENELQRGEIERVVRRLMVGKEGEEIRHRAMDLKRKIDVCISEGGSSNNCLKKLVECILSF